MSRPFVRATAAPALSEDLELGDDPEMAAKLRIEEAGARGALN